VEGGATHRKPELRHQSAAHSSVRHRDSRPVVGRPQLMRRARCGPCFSRWWSSPWTENVGDVRGGDFSVERTKRRLIFRDYMSSPTTFSMRLRQGGPFGRAPEETPTAAGSRCRSRPRRLIDTPTARSFRVVSFGSTSPEGIDTFAGPEQSCRLPIHPVLLHDGPESSNPLREDH